MFSRVYQSFPYFLMSKEYRDAQFNLAPETYNQYSPLSDKVDNTEAKSGMNLSVFRK